MRPLTKSRYVDDILSGADSEEERELQIVQTQDCLKRGGFTMKFVAKSGEPPPAKASSGRSIGCLGLDWATEADTFSLAYDVSFFLKQPKSKVQLPVVDLGDQVNLAKALAGDLVTRAGILSRVAEFYDPCGLFEKGWLHDEVRGKVWRAATGEGVFWQKYWLFGPGLGHGGRHVQSGL